MPFNAGQKLRPSQLGGGHIVASWTVTPAVMSIVGEVDVINRTWTPTATGCYWFRGIAPFDVSAVGTDAKMRIRVDGGEIDYDLRQGIQGVFVGRLRCMESFDVTTLTSKILRVTVERGAGTATLNSRLVGARIDIYRAGDTGIRA